MSGERFAPPGSTYELGIAIAQLRHAYKQIVNGEVRDWQSFAKGLLAPQIERLEEFHAAVSPLHDVGTTKVECAACDIERKQRAAVAERKRLLDAALGRDEPVRVTIDICPVHSIRTKETKDDCAGCVHRDEALRNATHRGDILHMALAAIFIESNTGSGLVEAAESRERMRAIAREAIEQ